MEAISDYLVMLDSQNFATKIRVIAVNKNQLKHAWKKLNEYEICTRRTQADLEVIIICKLILREVV